MLRNKVPHLNASDHLPIEAEFVPDRRRNPQRQNASDPVQQFIPKWLYQRQEFQQSLVSAVEGWIPNRSRGFGALEEFSNLVRQVASTCLRDQVYLAKTPEHKYQVCASVVRKSLMQNGYATLRQRQRFISVLPDLENAIPAHVHENGQFRILDPIVRQMMRDFAAEITQRNAEERASLFEHDPVRGVSMQRGNADGNTLKTISESLPRDFYPVCKLWDPDANDFTYDEDRIAALLEAAAMDRQSDIRGDDTLGNEILAQSGLDLRGARTEVTDDEVLAAIRDGDPDAKPGPNGLIGIPYHICATYLIPIFRETFEDLMSGVQTPVSFSKRLLVAAGKNAKCLSNCEHS